MKLVSFEVQRYRNVLESGVVEVAQDVTCLVGKNEAGKTALLHALERLNPARPASFNVEDEYPRWRLVPDRKKGLVDQALPIKAVFELEPADSAVVEALVGEGVVTEGQVRVVKGYDNVPEWTIGIDEQRAVNNLLDHISIEQADRDALATDSFANLLESVAAARTAADAAAESAAGGGEVEEPASEPAHLSAIEQAVQELEQGHTLDEVVRNALEPRLPKFFYFSNYSILPGRTNLAELGGEEPPASTDLQTARALLALAGTDTTRLGEEDYELRKAELEAVSNDLTRQVFEYWTQSEQLSVVIDVDKETENTPNGQTAVTRYLDIRVRDNRHGYTNNFGQRSSGFQWFFSFLAAFSEFADYEAGIVILLDEPALSLHARAQADFLRFINERIATAGQVIYTTHSPFMVETGRLDRVRVVEDQGPDIGTIVSSDVFATDRDTIFPLQAALGYDIAQSLFIAPESLIVEGSSDYTYLTTISDHLVEQGRTGLDERFTLMPVGGASNIPTFVALLGAHLHVTVLVDSGVTGAQKLTAMAQKGLLERQRLVTVGEITESANADIEDLFTPGDYLKLYNAAFGTSLKVSELPAGSRIVKQIAATVGADFDHGRPADYLLRRRDDVLPKLSAGTLDHFEKLFMRLNATLGHTN